MPVLEHVFAAIFNFVAFPQYTSIDSTIKHSQPTHDKADPKSCPSPTTRRTKSASGTFNSAKRSKMEAVKRRSRVFSLSLPMPPLVSGPPIQTPPRQEASGSQREQTNLDPRLPSSSRVHPVAAESGSTGCINSKEKGQAKGWATWAHQADVVGATTTEDLTKLVATGASPLPNATATGQGEEKKKGVKRKRSNSSVASISSSFTPLSKKLSGLMARTPKKAKTMGNGLSQASNTVQIPPRDPTIARSDIHAALRENGCRLVGSSVDVDDLFTDKPDHVILSIPSILRIFSGEQQQLPPSYKKPNRTSIDTLTYCLWLACRRSLALFSFTEDREEEEAVKEERECYTMQLLMAEVGMSILERLPSHGVMHVPVDPRVSNNVVDTIHHTLYLVEAFIEVGASPADLHRLVFDIPATTAGIHAGQVLSLQHNLHINYILVSDVVQTAACLAAKPYGVSVPTRLMKNVGDERVRATMHTSALTGMNLLPGAKPPNANLLVGKGKASVPSEQDIRDHPAFESIRAILRLVELRAPGVVVSARDVDFRRFLYALSGVHAISLTQECLVVQRWHAYLAEGTPAQALYYAPTEGQARRADERARAVTYKNVDGAEVVGTAWSIALREEVEHGTARNPKVQRRYVDKEWISGSGLSKAVRDLAFSTSNAAGASLQPPEGFMTSLGGASKRAVLMVMEGGLEEECKMMGRLHMLVGQYLEQRFAPLRTRGMSRAGTEEV